MISYVDIIMTDWHMPGMSGLEFLRVLRADARFKNTPIVMTTPETAGENIIAALQAGASTYLIKPFNRKQFVEKVGPLLRYSRSAAESAAVMSAVTQSGTIGDGDLGNIIQFLIQSGKRGCCDLFCEDCHGRIYFNSGRVAGAEIKSMTKEAAFYFCFNTNVTKYRFHEGPVNVPAKCEISMSSTALLLEAAARGDTSKYV
jgi:CheY-like chemotaxis protein